MVKNLPASAGDTGSIPGLGRSPGGGMAIHSNILGWEIPWTEESGRFQSMGSQRVRDNLTTERTCMHKLFLAVSLHGGGVCRKQRERDG